MKDWPSGFPIVCLVALSLAALEWAAEAVITAPPAFIYHVVKDYLAVLMHRLVIAPF